MMRLRGGLLVLCGLFLGGTGLWLLYLTLGWAWPSFVPAGLVPAVQGPQGTEAERLASAPGLAALFLLAFAGASTLLGLGMMILGRRNGMLFNLILALFAIFAVVVAGVVISGRG